MSDQTTDLPEIEPAVTVEYQCHFQLKKGRKKLLKGKTSHPKPIPEKSAPIPRITKMLAIAHYYQKLLDDGSVKDYAELARLTGVSRARLTQIMNLTFLAPEIQETIINFSKAGRIKTERRIRMIAEITLWDEQLKYFETQIDKSQDI